MKVRGRSAFIAEREKVLRFYGNREACQLQDEARLSAGDVISEMQVPSSKSYSYLVDRLDHLQAELNYTRQKLNEHLDRKKKPKGKY